MEASRELPAFVASLFWDVGEDVDLERHLDYVLERVMTRGGWEAMRWLRTRYPESVLADFLRRKGGRLPPRERGYWALVAGLQMEVPSGGGRPTWAGS